MFASPPYIEHMFISIEVLISILNSALKLLSCFKNVSVLLKIKYMNEKSHRSLNKLKYKPLIEIKGIGPLI